MKTLILINSLIIFVAFYSCKKKDEEIKKETKTELTVREMLTSKRWKIKKDKHEEFLCSNDNSYFLYYDDDYSADTVRIEFLTDGTWGRQNAYTKVFTGGYSWSLNTNQTELTFGSIKGPIQVIDENTIFFKGNNKDNNCYGLTPSTEYDEQTYVLSTY